MQIQKIFIKNFRSIGEKGLDLSFPIGKSILIGENNVGKSSVFQAINKMVNLNPNEPIQWEIENWHKSDQKRTIELVLTISLNDNDINKIITFFNPLKISNESFKRLFSNKLIYRIIIKAPKNEPISFFTLGDLTINHHYGKIGSFENNFGGTTKYWIEIARKLDENSSINKFKQLVAGKEDISDFDFSAIVISFNNNIHGLFLNLLKENIISIEEYREKPKEVLNSSLVSPTGLNLLSILFQLKNKRRNERQKYEEIVQKFHEIFPNLDLDVIQEGDEIKIYIQKENVESTTYFLGAGIIQILLLITHIVAYNDKIILIDHPELHLHPHAERNLASLINESNNQILLITHSPYFISLDKQHTIFRLVQKNLKTEIYTLSPKHITDNEYLKLEHLLDIDSKELFFARKVLLVEGQTEYGAIPIFAQFEGYSFDKNGISIIYVGGKSNLVLFAKLCDGFHIPYLILADNDAIETLEKFNTLNESKKSQIIFLDKDFEAILPEDLKNEAQELVGKSKPRVGKYVAKKMVDENLEIPKEISELITKLQEL